MRRIYYPTKDASIYEEFDWRNTGHDEILEVGKSSNGVNRIRSLLQFDITSISASIAAGTIPFSASFDLKMFVARADDLSPSQVINIYQVSRSWDEGSGYFYQNVNVPFTSSRDPSGGFFENNGVTWNNKSSGSTWSITGSEFYTGTIVSGTVADPVVDMTFDVSSLIRSFVSGTVSNNGLLLKFPDNDETNVQNAGDMRFFSRQTHTVYAPQLIIKWDDQQYITGSISGSTINAVVTPRTLRNKYRLTELVRVDLSVRDRYPVKTFDTMFSNFAGVQRLPSSSYFSIVDVQSNATVIPFDDYSKVSCDGSGSYFNFKVEGMYPGRKYKVLVKVVGSNYEHIHDAGNIFSIENV